MNRLLLGALITGMCIFSVYSPPEQPTTVKMNSVQKWLQDCTNLDEDHHERLLQFLQSMSNCMQDADDQERKSIAKSVQATLEHTKQTLQTIKTALEIAQLHAQEKEANFNLQEIISASSSSQGQMRANVSAALKAVTVQESGMIQLTSNLKKLLANITSKELQKQLKQEELLHHLITQVYQSATVPLDVDAVKLYADLLKQLQTQSSKKSDKR